MTECEKYLWQKLRAKQILGVQFYRQKPIGHYIVDFYAPKVKLVIELDGGQHFEEKHALYDKNRTVFLNQLGLAVLRYDNLQVIQNLDDVVRDIYLHVKSTLALL
jgi:very-short-patch-repair endonuclease